MSPSRKSRELLHLCRFGGAPARLAGGPLLPAPCWALGHEGRACRGLLPRAPLLPGARWGRAVTVARGGGQAENRFLLLRVRVEAGVQ